MCVPLLPAWLELMQGCACEGQEVLAPGLVLQAIRGAHWHGTSLGSLAGDLGKGVG